MTLLYLLEVQDKPQYHGTIKNFDKIDPGYGRDKADFGKGFYTTMNLEQAKVWATRKKDKQGLVIEYKIYNLENCHDVEIKELLEYNEEWLQFVANCRTKDAKDNKCDGIYDIVYDRLADGKTKDLVKQLEAYSAAINSPDGPGKKKTIEKAKKKVLDEALWDAEEKNRTYDQFCFKTTKAVTLLKRVALHKQKEPGSTEWIRIEERSK